MDLLIGEKLHRNDGDGLSEVNTLTLRGIVVLYFSAHWCGPCRSFTPQLRKFYERAKSDGRAVEVVFISSDHDEKSFKEYFATMPWHAIPYADRGRQKHMAALCQIRGIPGVALLDAQTGGLLDLNARSKVMQPGFISTLPRLIDLEAALMPEPSSGTPILIRYQGKEFELECEPCSSAVDFVFQLFHDIERMSTKSQDRHGAYIKYHRTKSTISLTTMILQRRRMGNASHADLFYDRSAF
eukprot:Skav209816  [mRNA]  locus=scaffold2424:39234:39956:+ [translate_table: standard]